MELVLFIAAVIPVIFLCNHVYKKDINKETKGLLFKIFGLGMLICIPVSYIEVLLLDSFPVEDNSIGVISMFINVFIGVGIVEEGFKWLVTKKCGYNNKEFDEIYDIIVYATFASLGFACFENIFYVFENGLGNAILRAITSIPGHACFGITMGYYFSKAKINAINNNKNSKKYLLLSILIPTLLHTTYDALLFLGSELSVLVFFVFDITMVIYCFKLVNKMASVQYSLKNNYNPNMNNNYSPNMNYCPMCGTVNNNYTYCPYCGYKIK